MSADKWYHNFYKLIGNSEMLDEKFLEVFNMLKQQRVPHQAFDFAIQRQAAGDGVELTDHEDDSRFNALHEQHKHYQALAKSTSSKKLEPIPDAMLFDGISKIMNAKRQRYENIREQTAAQMKIAHLRMQQSIEANDTQAANAFKMHVHQEQAKLRSAEKDLSENIECSEKLMKDYIKTFPEE